MRIHVHELLHRVFVAHIQHTCFENRLPVLVFVVVHAAHLVQSVLPVILTGIRTHQVSKFRDAHAFPLRLHHTLLLLFQLLRSSLQFLGHLVDHFFARRELAHSLFHLFFSISRSLLFRLPRSRLLVVAARDELFLVLALRAAALTTVRRACVSELPFAELLSRISNLLLLVKLLFRQTHSRSRYQLITSNTVQKP